MDELNITQCPWCGASGDNFDESERPSDYRHHDIADVVTVVKRCNLGIGCDEAAVCYAAAMGEPDRCGK